MRITIKITTSHNFFVTKDKNANLVSEFQMKYKCPEFKECNDSTTYDCRLIVG
jgi:hypothetical protein